MSAGQFSGLVFRKIDYRSNTEYKDYTNNDSDSSINNDLYSRSISEGKPKVVNLRVKELRKNGYSNIEEWLKEHNHVYIGRNMRINIGNGQWCHLPRSKWHNPYKGNRHEVVKQFESYALNKFNQSDYSELTGKILGCWCHPELCHGHALVKLWSQNK